MEKEFVPYELALKLKELGFKLDYRNSFGVWCLDSPNKEPHLIKCGILETIDGIFAPLWQQAFDWFRLIYDLDTILVSDSFNHESKKLREYKIISLNKSIILEKYVDQKYWIRKGCFYTYEESRLECLKKLIEIIENEQQVN